MQKIIRTMYVCIFQNRCRKEITGLGRCNGPINFSQHWLENCFPRSRFYRQRFIATESMCGSAADGLPALFLCKHRDFYRSGVWYLYLVLVDSRIVKKTPAHRPSHHPKDITSPRLISHTSQNPQIQPRCGTFRSPSNHPPLAVVVPRFGRLLEAFTV